MAAGSTADLEAKDEMVKKLMLEILWGPSENCGVRPPSWLHPWVPPPLVFVRWGFPSLIKNLLPSGVAGLVGLAW